MGTSKVCCPLKIHTNEWRVSLSGYHVKDSLSQTLLNVQLWQVGFWFFYIHRRSDKRQPRNQNDIRSLLSNQQTHSSYLLYMTAIQADLTEFNFKKGYKHTVRFSVKHNLVILFTKFDTMFRSRPSSGHNYKKISKNKVQWLVRLVQYIRNTWKIFEMWWWRRMEKISWTDHVRNEGVLLRVKEQRNILHEISKQKANWIGHILRRNCILQQVIEGKIKRGG